MKESYTSKNRIGVLKKLYLAKAMNPKSLSFPEEAKLIRSNKKIKERHHASFKGGENSDIGLRLD